MTPRLSADIARCPGGDCQLKQACLRHIAPPPDGAAERVVSFLQPPFRPDEQCEYYVEWPHAWGATWPNLT